MWMVVFPSNTSNFFVTQSKLIFRLNFITFPQSIIFQLCFQNIIFLYRITQNKTAAPLSHQSAYSLVQLLACFNALPTHISSNPNSILSSALVLHALISYQPEDIIIKSSTAIILGEVLKKWFQILIECLNRSLLIDNGLSGMFYVVLCQLGLDVLR